MMSKRFTKYGIYSMAGLLIGVSLLFMGCSAEMLDALAESIAENQNASASTSTPHPVSYGVRGRQMHVTMSNGGDIVVPANIPDYRADFGFWLSGDFNGDRIMDLLHMVTTGVGDPNYCHVHFSDGNGGFRGPTRFDFPCAANPQCDYNIRLGNWSAEDIDGDGSTDFKHNPQLPDNRRHCWLSLGNGDFQLQACP